jgi:hypothetical protein
MKLTQLAVATKERVYVRCATHTLPVICGSKYIVIYGSIYTSSATYGALFS